MTQTFTDLIARARNGDRSATGELFSLVYQQLHALAHTQRRRLPQRTLNTTALVHEAYLKLAGREALDIRDRAHFMATAATAVRHVLIDHARQRLAGKRGSGQVRNVPLDAVQYFLTDDGNFSDTDADLILALSDALERLRERSERQARVVDCRFFAGMSIEETARALGSSPATVKRDWSIAQAWLHHELSERLG